MSRMLHLDRSFLLGLTLSSVLHVAAFVALSHHAVPITPAKPPPAVEGEYAIRISLLPKAHAISLSPPMAAGSDEKEKEKEKEKDKDRDREQAKHKELEKTTELDSAPDEHEPENEEPAPVRPRPSPRPEKEDSSPREPDEARDEPKRRPERTKQIAPEPDRVVETVAETDPPAPEEPPPPAAPGLREGVRLVGKLAPLYPRRCRRLGHEGTVRLEVKVDASGTVVSVRVVSSAGCDQLDRSAIAAIRAAAFRPARIGATPISSTVILPVVFRLR